MIDGDREMIRRYVVEAMHAMQAHLDALEVVVQDLSLGSRDLSGTRYRMESAFSKMRVQFAPPAGREERG